MAYKTFMLDIDNPCTFKGSALTSVQSADFALSASTTVGNADGAKLIQAILVDDIQGNFTINTVDQKLVAGYTPGDNGALVLNAVIEENEGGAAGSETLIITVGKAVVTDPSGSIGRAGEGTGSIPLQALDNGSGHIYTVS